VTAVGAIHIDGIAIPVDPLICRLRGITQGHGTTMKAIRKGEFCQYVGGLAKSAVTVWRAPLKSNVRSEKNYYEEN